MKRSDNPLKKVGKKKTVDAQRKLVFEVTQEDIDTAKRYDKQHCVIANALHSYPGVKSVEVGASFVHVNTETQVFRYQTPSVLSTALARFDLQGKWDLPGGIYQLSPPSPGQRLNSRRNIKHYIPKDRSTARYKINPRVIEYRQIKKEKAVKAEAEQKGDIDAS